MPTRSSALTAAGHLGWDVVEGMDTNAQRLGGSLFHFLNGVAFTGVRCTAVTWTTVDVAARAQAVLPPWISIHNRPVDSPPTFDIAYEGEAVTKFDITGIDMPPDVPSSTPRSDALHFCAMPFGDAAEILAASRPSTWSMQFHSAVMPEPCDLRQLETPPTFAFCTAHEHAQLAPALSALHSTTWIVTQRDRVVATSGGVVVAEFAFPPIESPIDTTGAGDLLAGSIVGCLRRGVPLELAVRFGTGVAAVSLADQGSESFREWWESAYPR